MLINDALIAPSVSTNTRHKGKRAKRGSIAINADPFQKLDLMVPNTKQAAEQLATNILQDLKRVLEVFKFYMYLLCYMYNTALFTVLHIYSSSA
jgi:hypothetical protein